MATITIPKRVCDRCGATVTENGGRFAFHSGSGPGDVSHLLGVPSETVGEMQAVVDDLSVDLCRTCKGSLLTWWTAPARASARTTPAEPAES